MDTIQETNKETIQNRITTGKKEREVPGHKNQKGKANQTRKNDRRREKEQRERE